MKVCAVIVTYGDRFHLLKQVIDACFREGVDKVIVVDNASVENSKNQLKEFEKQHKNNLKVIYLDENTGSAGGYKRGLQEAYKCDECEYILLLDDDNVIDKDFIILLKKYYIQLTTTSNVKDIVLLAYRNYEYLNDFIKDIDRVTNKKYYRGFDFISIIKKKFKYKKRDKLKNNTINIKKIPVAPYGGMFFPKKILDLIGFPNEKFYLYADDFEFSHRISKQYNLFLIPFLKIKDIDSSWCKNNKNFFYHPFINEGSDKKTYYLFRNSHYFEEKIMEKSVIVYQLNKIIYLSILSVIGLLNFKFKRIFIIFKAIRDSRKLKDE
jgi:GT2 family glycosyltransferase